MANSVYELEQTLKTWTFSDVSEQLRRHVYTRAKEAFAKSASDRDSIRTVEQLEKRKILIRRQFIESIGGIPDSTGLPLNSRTVDVVREDTLMIEKIIFESRPKAYITANLYKPVKAAGKNPAVLFLCGHEKEGKHAPMYQRVCRILANQGLIVLAMDPIGQGERFEYYEPETGENAFSMPTVEHNYSGMQCNLLGQSIARYFVHDAMGGIDYLLSRNDVDSDKIGVTGNSGGGVQTAMLMIVDERVGAAAPGTFISGMEDILLSGKPQDSEQVWPDTPDIDHADLLMMMAPRPVLILAAEYDFFPLEGTLKTVEVAKRFYSLYEKTDHLQLFLEKTTHTYSIAMAKAAAGFFARYFGLEKREAVSGNTSPIEMDKLFCTKTGFLPAEYRDVQTVFKTNLEEAKQIAKEKGKQKSFDWLREKVMGGRKFSSLNIKYVESGCIYNIRYSRVTWNTQEDMNGVGVCFKSIDTSGTGRPVAIMLWEGGTCAAGKHFDEIEDICSQGYMAFVVDICGEGCLKPNQMNSMQLDAPTGTLYTLNSHLIRLGDSIAAIRVYDLLKSIEVAAALTGSNGAVSIYAVGRYSLYARLSALFHPGMKVGATESQAFLKRVASEKYYDERKLQTLIIPGILCFPDIADNTGCREKTLKILP